MRNLTRTWEMKKVKSHLYYLCYPHTDILGFSTPKISIIDFTLFQWSQQQLLHYKMTNILTLWHNSVFSQHRSHVNTDGHKNTQWPHLSQGCLAVPVEISTAERSYTQTACERTNKYRHRLSSRIHTPTVHFLPWPLPEIISIWCVYSVLGFT